MDIKIIENEHCRDFPEIRALGQASLTVDRSIYEEFLSKEGVTLTTGDGKMDFMVTDVTLPSDTRQTYIKMVEKYKFESGCSVNEDLVSPDFEERTEFGRPKPKAGEGYKEADFVLLFMRIIGILSIAILVLCVGYSLGASGCY